MRTAHAREYSELFTRVMRQQLCELDWKRAEWMAAGNPLIDQPPVSCNGYACTHHKNLVVVHRPPPVLEHPDCPCCECEVFP